MITYIKYLASLVLIVGLTVNECNVYPRLNEAANPPLSSLIARRGHEPTDSEVYVYAQWISSAKIHSYAQGIFLRLRNICNKQVQVILKLRLQLFQEISSHQAQQVFLTQTITSSNSYSCLYKA